MSRICLTVQREVGTPTSRIRPSKKRCEHTVLMSRICLTVQREVGTPTSRIRPSAQKCDIYIISRICLSLERSGHTDEPDPTKKCMSTTTSLIRPEPVNVCTPTSRIRPCRESGGGIWLVVGCDIPGMRWPLKFEMSI
jgi:hypothetical protein